MNIDEITSYLESLAPLAYQESYDNCGLLVGKKNETITGVLITLDCTEEVIEEAVAKNCNLIIAHHPIIFKGLKRLTGSNYVERTVLKAIQYNVALYAIHTNLDNVYTGVNKKIADKLGLINLCILNPKKDSLSSLTAFLPTTHSSEILHELYAAGAGQLGNYKNCSFQTDGLGTFKPTESANPHVGEAGAQTSVKETRIELIFPSHLQSSIVNALKKKHPYEEVAYFINPLSNENQEVGAGMLGELNQASEPIEFLQHVKKSLNLKVIRYTPLLAKKVKKVAICGGSGSFLLSKAIRAQADMYISADFKYHEFFDADGHLTIADIGHYESEVFTKDLIAELLTKKFPTFAVNFSTTITNPISYYL